MLFEKFRIFGKITRVGIAKLRLFNVLVGRKDQSN